MHGLVLAEFWKMKKPAQMSVLPLYKTAGSLLHTGIQEEMGTPPRYQLAPVRDNRSGGFMNFLELVSQWPDIISQLYLGPKVQWHSASAVFPMHLFHSTCGNHSFMQMQDVVDAVSKNCGFQLSWLGVISPPVPLWVSRSMAPAAIQLCLSSNMFVPCCLGTTCLHSVELQFTISNRMIQLWC